MLRGAPDLSQPLRQEGLTLFHPYEGIGPYHLMPNGLALARQANQQPDFRLELVRGQNPSLPPEPYGRLDFRVVATDATAAALMILRDRDPAAQLVPLTFTGGFLRLRPFLNDQSVPEPLLAPLPLAWNGLEIARFSHRLPAIAIQFLVELLQESELLPLDAIAELEFTGVSPRLPLQVRFDPAELIAALATLADDQRRVSQAAIVQYFINQGDNLPLDLIGSLEADQRQAFAEAMADRIRLYFATFVPAPDAAADPHLALATVKAGNFRWDLAEPLRVPRPIKLTLPQALESAQHLTQQQGLATVFKQTIVPPIPTGFKRIEVKANLPDALLGVLAIGVTIRVEPKLPFRPQAQVKTIELSPSQSTATLDLRFSPLEPLEYKVSTYVVVQDGRGIEQLTSATIVHTRDRLDLSLADFPVDFLPLTATTDLLQQAVLRGQLQQSLNGVAFEQVFELRDDQPIVTLVIPQQSVASLSLEAVSRSGLGTVKLDSLPLQPLQIGLYSFREYGRHQVKVTCQFQQQHQPVVFEFWPEGEDQPPQLLAFRPSRPVQHFAWVARSPFQARYRYRLKPLGQQAEPPAWSDYQSPFAPLTLPI